MKLKDISTGFNKLKISVAYSTPEYFKRGEWVVTIPYSHISYHVLRHNIDQETNVLHVSVYGDELLILLEEPPVDWTKVSVDTKVLVRDSCNDEWIRRYFHRYEEGKYYCFKDGSDSWSDEKQFFNGVPWNYCKLWKEGED